jgi:hypothetical protein
MIPGRYYKKNKRERSVSKTQDSHFAEKTEHREHLCFLKCPPNNEERMH